MSEFALPVTTAFVALYIVTLTVMIGWIGIFRGRTNILRADGQSATLFKRIRIHGNLTEIAPAVILAVGAAELAGLDAFWLWATLVAFVMGRVLHFILYDTKSRAIGMSLSSMPAAAIALWALFQVW